MSKKTDILKEKIVTATIDCIEDGGLHSLTIRRIAVKAGVNSAAINYYFSSKEKLVERALSRALDNALADTDKIFRKSEGRPEELLREFLLYYLNGALRYPRLMRAQLADAFLREDYRSPFIVRFNQALSRMAEALHPHYPSFSLRDLRISIMQMASAVFFPGLLPGFFQKDDVVDLNDPAGQVQYVKHLVAMFSRSERAGEPPR